MIRINLLPTKRKKKAKPIATYLVSAVVATLVSIALAFFASSYMGSRIDDLHGKHADNKKLIKSLDKKIKEVKDFEKINKKFTERKKVIEELTAGQSLPVRILDELSQRLSDGIWIQSLNIKEENVSLSGTGFNNNEIVDFVQDLKGSKLFREVTLKGTRKQGKGSVDVFTFSLTFVVGS